MELRRVVKVLVEEQWLETAADLEEVTVTRVPLVRVCECARVQECKSVGLRVRE